MADTLFLSNDDVVNLAEIEDYVAAVRHGYRQRGQGAPTEPKTNLWPGEDHGRLASYVATLPETGVMGGLFHATGRSGGDTRYVSPLFDAVTGEVLAVIDGAGVNPLKTGAAGAIGVDVLARADASTVGMIGSGSQAWGQLLGTAVVRDLNRVRVYSPTSTHRRAFASELSTELGIDVVPVASSEAALRDADIVITATTSTRPTFDGDVLKPGTHVTAMGQSNPDIREIDCRTVKRATYVTDLRDRTLRDAGGFLAALEHGVINESHIHAELGDIVAGRRPGRRTADEITLFDSGGTAIETVAATAMLYEKAKDAGRGRPMTFVPSGAVLRGFGGT